MKRSSDYIKNILLLISTTATILLLLVFIDRCFLSRIITNKYSGIIFPANEERYYQSPEFSYTANINSLGFRDREFDRGNNKIRIVAIGDSFTFGWGVENSCAWPKVLEEKLSSMGHNVEVANLGQPGGNPATYARIAEKAIPILKPELTVVAVLQGDDLEQIKQDMEKKNLKENNRANKVSIAQCMNIVKAVARKICPHLIASIRNRPRTKPPLEDAWKNQARELVSFYSPHKRSRFEMLDEEVKGAFLNGQLNPLLVNLSITAPDYYTETLNIDDPDILSCITEMGKYIERIKDIAVENGSNLIVISVPNGIYTSEDCLRSRKRLGFAATPEMLKTSAADEAIRLACEIAETSFFSVTDEFRKIAKDRKLYFELDDHFNREGQHCYADLLAPIVEKVIVAQSQ